MIHKSSPDATNAGCWIPGYRGFQIILVDDTAAEYDMAAGYSDKSNIGVYSRRCNLS